MVAIYLLIFLSDLPNGDNGVLKSPTMTVLLLISFVKFSKIFFIYLHAPIVCAHMFMMVIFLGGLLPQVLCSDILCLIMVLVLKSTLSYIGIAIPGFLNVHLHGMFFLFLLSLHFDTVEIFCSEVGLLLDSVFVGCIFLSIQLFYVF